MTQFRDNLSTNDSDPQISTRKKLAFDSPEQEAYLNLWRTYDRLRVLEDKLFGENELTAQQYNALRLLAVRSCEGIPTLEVARRLVSRAPDITRLINPLVEKGWVTRTRPEGNRRMVRLAITPLGLELLKQLDGPVKECGAAQLGHLSREDLQELCRLLRLARMPHEEISSIWAPEA
jgi:DNA-binding MarR family transcriptional regulator